MTTYGYDANDRLINERHDQTGTAYDTCTRYSYGPADAWTLQTQQNVYAGLTPSGTPATNTCAFDAQGRLGTLTQGGATTIYSYSPEGTRLAATTTLGGTTTTVCYLVDPCNPTGYSQVLEERTTRGGSTSIRTYTLGWDVLAQYDTAQGNLTFLYDGHGSTRALVGVVGTVPGIVQSYAYRAYGIPIVSAKADLTTKSRQCPDELSLLHELHFPTLYKRVQAQGSFRRFCEKTTLQVSL